jgi:hypothetical protein
MAFTVIPSGPSSLARVRINPITPCFEAVEQAWASLTSG